MITPSYSAITGTLYQYDVILDDWKLSWSSALILTTFSNYDDVINYIDSSITDLKTSVNSYFTTAQSFYRNKFEGDILAYNTYILVKYKLKPAVFSSTITSLSSAQDIEFFGDSAEYFTTTIYQEDTNSPSIGEISNNIIEWYKWKNYLLDWSSIGSYLFDIDIDEINDLYTCTISSAYESFKQEIENFNSVESILYDNFYSGINSNTKNFINYVIFSKPKSFIQEEIDNKSKLLYAPFTFSDIFDDFSITISGLYPE